MKGKRRRRGERGESRVCVMPAYCVAACRSTDFVGLVRSRHERGKGTLSSVKRGGRQQVLIGHRSAGGRGRRNCCCGQLTGQYCTRHINESLRVDARFVRGMMVEYGCRSAEIDHSDIVSLTFPYLQKEGRRGQYLFASFQYVLPFPSRSLSTAHGSWMGVV